MFFLTVTVTGGGRGSAGVRSVSCALSWGLLAGVAWVYDAHIPCFYVVSREYLVIFDTSLLLIDCVLSFILSAFFAGWGKFATIAVI